MITPSQSSHWYTPEGEPAYNATLRDARRAELYPSVTQVLGILAKPAVESWAVNLMSEVCYRAQPVHDDCDMNAETLDEYRERIEPIYKARRSEAAERGSAIHDYAESYLLNGKAEPVPGYERQCAMLADWIDANIASAVAEQSFAHDGYGGRIDAFGFLKDGRRFLLDFKTQDLKGKPKPNYYDEWRWQLSAYKAWLDSSFGTVELGADGLKFGRPPHQAMSVVIDTGDIQKIHVKEYSGDEMAEAYGVFKAILAAWCAIKGL